MTDRHRTREYLISCRTTKDAAGDLVRRMRAEPDVPSLFPSRHALTDYIFAKGWPTGGVGLLWRRYSEWQKHHRRRGIFE